MILFGGVGQSFFGDVWALDTQRELWTQLSIVGEQPDGRHSHAAAYVPGRGMFVFAGSTNRGLMSDLWEVSFTD
jgi:hypothetical protein